MIDSLFQIQTRLQNLGTNLQNKSNDIEVLAVSRSPPPICCYSAEGWNSSRVREVR